MKPDTRITPNKLKVQIEKHVILSALSFLFLVSCHSQSISGNVCATASATVVTEIISVEMAREINFIGMHQIYKKKVSVNPWLKIIAYDNAYSISLSASDITIKKNGSAETIDLTLFAFEHCTDSGIRIFTMDATLNTGNKQQSGGFTSITPLAITVNYD